MDPSQDGVPGSYSAAGAQADVGHRRIRKWVAVTTAAVLVASVQVLVQVATTTPAGAVPGIFTVNVFSANDSLPFKAVEANCPPGYRVLGGGGSVNDGLAGQVALTWSGPRDNNDGTLPDTWMVVATAPAGYSDTWQLRALAICGPSLPGLVMVSALTFSDATFQSISAACPAGKRVLSVGGGLTAMSNVDAFLQLVRPDGTLTVGRLTAREGARHYPGTWNIWIDVLCANPIAGQQYVDTVVNSAGGHAFCPAGKGVVGLGGGGGLSDSGPYYLQTLMPHTDLHGSYAAMTGAPPSGGVVVEATCTS